MTDWRAAKARRTKILGKDAPDKWWDEIAMLREKVAALEAENKRLLDKCDSLAVALKCASLTCSPIGARNADEVLHNAGYELP